MTDHSALPRFYDTLSEYATFVTNLANRFHLAEASSSDKLRPTCVNVLKVPQSHMISLDLLAGYSCPSANECLARHNFKTGKLDNFGAWDEPCFAAKIEHFRKNVRDNHRENLQVLKSARYGYTMFLVLSWALRNRRTLEYVRISSSGDIFDREYWNALNLLAESRPNVVFWGYTKEIYVFEPHARNLYMTYSMGGKNDDVVNMGDFPTCTVVMDEEQAYRMGLPFSCKSHDAPDDIVYIMNNQSFALPLH